MIIINSQDDFLHSSDSEDERPFSGQMGERNEQATRSKRDKSLEPGLTQSRSKMGQTSSQDDRLLGRSSKNLDLSPANQAFPNFSEGNTQNFFELIWI